MIWLGIIVGFTVGVVFITLCYMPLVDKMQMLEQKLLCDQQLIDDAIKALQVVENENRHLRTDLEVMHRMASREVYKQFFDAPYRSN